jgi:hypothetical protein
MSWIQVFVYVYFFLSVKSRLCGTPRVCFCLRSLGEINCVKRGLFRVPNFEKEGLFEVLDLRKNHIRYLRQENIKKFGIIDIRENSGFDCDDFRKNFDNIVFPIIVSDCKNVPGATTKRPDRRQKYSSYVTKSDKDTVSKSGKISTASIRTTPTSPGFLQNMSTILQFQKLKDNLPLISF